MLACDVDFGEYLGGGAVEDDDGDDDDEGDDAEYSGDEDD